ncbi:MAG TPA: hypothetical protein PLV68_11480, partial [Ilumatobacteraceae bacterium]|nr:hypothetical protein [Ilumatobacteraceae bacterium]
MKLALAACLVAAVAYGVGAVMQALGARRAGLSTAGHDAHQAGTPGQADAGRDLHEAGGIGTLLRQPIFLIGLLVDFAAWSISR